LSSKYFFDEKAKKLQNRTYQSWKALLICYQIKQTSVKCLISRENLTINSILHTCVYVVPIVYCMAAWCSGQLICFENRRSWVRGPPGCKGLVIYTLQWRFLVT
jgi:hypothetical protein